MAAARRLTVLQVLPAMDGGGVERGTVEVAGALVRAGHRALVVSRGGRMVSELESSGAEHVPMPVGRKSPLALALVPALRRLLRTEAVDVVHARSRLPAWIAWLAWRGLAPAARPRFVTTVHGLYSVNRYSAIMTRGERVIAVSNAVAEYVLSAYPGTDPGRLRVIRRGVDTAAFPRGHVPDPAWRAAHPQLEGCFVLTLPGRISRLKGHEDLLRVLARLRDAPRPLHALVVGESGRGRQRYERELQAAAAGLPVTFTGHRGDMRDVYAASDAVLSLSRQPESFGRTVAEALALGVPVLGYDHGGVGEILAEAFPPGAVPVGDVAALEAHIRDWMVTPPVVPPLEGFSLEHMLASTLDLYAEVAAGREAS